MASTGVWETLLAALQASVSVLLVISYGGLAAKLGILSPDSTKAVSKVCVRMFLPALLVTKLGAELDAGSAGKYGIIVAWGLLAHFISFLIGILGHFVFKMPDWVTVAVYVSIRSLWILNDHQNKNWAKFLPCPVRSSRPPTLGSPLQRCCFGTNTPSSGVGVPELM